MSSNEADNTPYLASGVESLRMTLQRGLGVSSNMDSQSIICLAARMRHFSRTTATSIFESELVQTNHNYTT